MDDTHTYFWFPPAMLFESPVPELNFQWFSLITWHIFILFRYQKKETITWNKPWVNIKKVRCQKSTKRHYSKVHVLRKNIYYISIWKNSTLFTFRSRRFYWILCRKQKDQTFCPQKIKELARLDQKLQLQLIVQMLAYLLLYNIDLH